MSLTEELTEHLWSLSSEQISDPDYAAAKILLLDALGCVLAGWKADGCRSIIEQMCEWGGRAESRVLLYGNSLPSPLAAFANSTMIHAMDLDDIYIPGTLHISSIVVPAMLAIAEKHASTGRQALMALILGVEAAARIENAGRDYRRGDGFLPTSLAGGFGGVITAAKLMNMDVGSCVNALGINYAQVAGNRQGLFDSTLTKRIQPAFAVRSALWSVALAKRNITGPRYSLEGNAGYYRLYLDVPADKIPASLSSLSDGMQIRHVAFKRYPSCGANHPIQMSAERLRVEERLSLKDIDRIELFGQPPGGPVSRPFSIGVNPQVDAQFNVAWAAAHTLARGPASFSDYSSDRVVADTRVIALAKAITYIQAPEDLPDPPPLPEGYPSYNARWQGIVVHTTDGRRLMRCSCPAETFAPGNMTWQQAIDKFMLCADYSQICPPVQAKQIVERVRLLDTANNLDSLLSVLSIPAITAKGAPYENK